MNHKLAILKLRSRVRSLVCLAADDGLGPKDIASVLADFARRALAQHNERTTDAIPQA